MVREIPGHTTFSLGPARLSDRSFFYVIGLQLAIGSGASSRWAAAIGLVVGVAYLLLGRGGITIPKPIATFCGGILLPILDPPPTLSRREQLRQDMDRVRNERIAARGGGGGGGAEAATGMGAGGGAEAADAAAIAAAAAGDEGLRYRGGGGVSVGAEQQTDVLLPSHGRGGGRGGAMPVREEDIEQLQAICARGRIDVIAALQRTNNNVEAAADWLLSHD